MLYLDNAEYREVVDVAIDVAGGFRHDDFREAIVLVFVGREDFFAGDGITDIKCDNGGFVDVAVVVEQGADTNWRGSGKFGNVVLKDGAFVGDLATNIVIDDTSKGKDVVDRDTLGLLLGWIG